MMYECFLQAYHMTKDEYFLKPIRFVSDQRMKGIGDGNQDQYIPGSFEWSLSILKSRIPAILMKYRLITGDTSYDTIIQKDARGYERYIFDGDIGKLQTEMVTQRRSLSLPEEWYTTEVRWTDRLFASVRYFNLVLDEPLPGFNEGFLFSCLTGNIGNYQIMPLFGVKWITEPTDIAILTEVNSTNEFRAQLFHFGNEPRKMKVRFLNLNDGTYRWHITGGKRNRIKLDHDNHEKEFILPPQKLCYINID